MARLVKFLFYIISVVVLLGSSLAQRGYKPCGTRRVCVARNLCLGTIVRSEVDTPNEICPSAETCCFIGEMVSGQLNALYKLRFFDFLFSFTVRIQQLATTTTRTSNATTNVI